MASASKADSTKEALGWGVPGRGVSGTGRQALQALFWTPGDPSFP